MVRNRHSINRDLTAHILFRRDGRNGELMISRDFGKRKGVAIQDAFLERNGRVLKLLGEMKFEPTVDGSICSLEKRPCKTAGVVLFETKLNVKQVTASPIGHASTILVSSGSSINTRQW
jgi:hypothetical protein